MPGGNELASLVEPPSNGIVVKRSQVFAGKKLLSGGGRLHHLQAVPPPIAIQESYAVDEDTWRIVGAETSPTAASWEPVVVIVCATIG